MPGLSGLSLHAVYRNGSKAGCLDSGLFFVLFKLSPWAEKLLKKESFRVVNQDPDIYGRQLLQLEVMWAKDLFTKPTNSQFLCHLNLSVSVRLRAGMGWSGSPQRWSNTGQFGVKLYILGTEDRFIGTFWAIGTKCIFFYSEMIVRFCFGACERKKPLM